MKLPVTGWKHTLRILGYKVIWKKRKTQRNNVKNEPLQYSPLEPRKLLAASPQLSVIDPQIVNEGQTFFVSATYTDADTSDTHTATISWGDGAEETISADSGMLEFSHAYGEAGRFQPTITITDSSNRSDEASFEIKVSNLAVGGIASQSSTSYGGNASRAIDGSTTGAWASGSVTHTRNAYDSWWQVDLQTLASINEIRIFNRTEAPGRLSNFRVSVWSELPETNGLEIWGKDYYSGTGSVNITSP